MTLADVMTMRTLLDERISALNEVRSSCMSEYHRGKYDESGRATIGGILDTINEMLSDIGA